MDALTTATAMWTDLRAAQSALDLAFLYTDWIGYDPFEDDPNQTEDEVRAILTDYIKEFCYSTGVHVDDVFV